jgi:hypothetical protein
MERIVLESLARFMGLSLLYLVGVAGGTIGLSVLGPGGWLSA